MVDRLPGRRVFGFAALQLYIKRERLDESRSGAQILFGGGRVQVYA